MLRLRNLVQERVWRKMSNEQITRICRKCPKILMILNGITAAIWVLVTAMNLYSLNTYAHVNSFNTYFTGGLALFYIGMTFGYACKYAKAKKLERGE